MKSSVAFRIAARVRSDLPILSDGFGLIRGRDDGRLLTDIVFNYTDTVSDIQGVGWIRNYGDSLSISF